MDARQVNALCAMVGDGSWRDAAALAARDPGFDPHNFGAGLLLAPRDVSTVQRLLAYCNDERISVVPQGGRTGLSGGAASAPGQVILSLEKLAAIEALDPLGRTAVVQAGVRLGALAARAAEHGLSPGIDLGARDSATIGGMVSTNAGGNAAFRHGTMRDRVLGLEAVLPDGTLLSALGAVRKRNEGLAVEQLLVGAEGTLGIITRVSLALVAADGPAMTALVAVADAAAAVSLCDAVQRAEGLVPYAIEVMSGNHVALTCRDHKATDFAALAASPYLVMLEVAARGADDRLPEVLQALAERGVVVDAIIAQGESQRRAMWRLREDWAVDRERPGGLWYDVSVPQAELPGYLDHCHRALAAHDPSLELFMIGHLADGNLHFTVNAARPITGRYEEIARLLMDGLPARAGSFSAEHGIGLEKKALLARLGDPGRLALMRAVKAAVDPRGIMNPGKVIQSAGGS